MTRAHIDPAQDLMTLVNVFTVQPENADALVKVLVDATHETMHHIDGFLSASIHRSADGRRVVNYAQWRSRADFEAMLTHAGAGVHMKAAAALAESYDPIVASVVDTTTSR